jgi:hypothetical protein
MGRNGGGLLLWTRCLEPVSIKGKWMEGIWSLANRFSGLDQLCFTSQMSVCRHKENHRLSRGSRSI